MEADTQALAGKLAFSVKGAGLAPSIIHGIHTIQNKEIAARKRSNLTRVVCFGGFKDSCECKSSVVTRRGCFPPLLSRRYFMDFCTDGNFLQQQDRLWQSHLTEAGGAGLAWTSTRGGEELQLPGPIQIQTGPGSLVWHASRPPRAVCRSSTDVSSLADPR